MVDAFFLNLTIYISIMTFFWILGVLLKNAAWADFGWSVCLVWLGLDLLFFEPVGSIKSMVLGGMVFLWALRLAIYLFLRNRTGEEDGRYHDIRERWEKRYTLFWVESFFYGIYLFQAILLALITAPFMVVVANVSPIFSWNEVLGVFLFTISFLGESIADYQLWNFKRKTEDSRAVYRGGLWAYTRHPNYFFEWCIWLSFLIYLLSSPLGYTFWGSFLVMTALLVKYSGVFLTEKHALKTKGEAYQRYIEEVSPFFPWFPHSK